ncbi:MAG: hypothetical protein NTY41_08785, partial [Proteobacteria bacterium]|nr:hypothetical protein [Pseudomonadota bacterium]
LRDRYYEKPLAHRIRTLASSPHGCADALRIEGIARQNKNAQKVRQASCRGKDFSVQSKQQQALIRSLFG